LIDWRLACGELHTHCMELQLPHATTLALSFRPSIQPAPALFPPQQRHNLHARLHYKPIPPLYFSFTYLERHSRLVAVERWASKNKKQASATFGPRKEANKERRSLRLSLFS
jgi:hypothetical protein